MKWTFQPVDSWFFRESRPWSTVGGVELASNFPPPARTVAGAIRTAIGEAKDVDWLAFSQGRHAKLRQYIGSGVSDPNDSNSEFGSFRMRGPYVERNNDLLFPAPAMLLRSKETGKISLMHPAAKGMRCDLGSSVRLPHAAGLLGAATLDGHWCSAEGLGSVLRGDAPPPESLVDRDALVADDARVGIARDNSLRTVHDGLLYQTSHVRLKNGVRIVAYVDGIPDDLQRKCDGATIRFGGEGRLAHITVSPRVQSDVPAPRSTPKRLTAILVLVTHSPADAGCEHLPPGFHRVDDQHGSSTSWRGTIRGVEMHIDSCATGRLVREGGWNATTMTPRPVESFTPAGSCYFCRAVGSDPEWFARIAKLHGQSIRGNSGDQDPLGRGEIVVGIWNDQISSGGAQ